MNIWPFGKHKQEIRADTEVTTPEVSSDVLLRALIGKTEMTREKALEIPTVQACINTIAGIVSSLPVNLYEKRDSGGKDGVQEVRDSRTFLLNNDTGDTMTAAQFWRAMIEDYYLGRGGYAYINWDGLTVRSIHYVDASYISFLKNTDPIFKDYDITVRGVSYRPYRFLKLLRKSKDGMESRPITEDNPTILSVAYNSLLYEEALVKKGGNKRGFLQSEKSLSTEAMEKLKDGFRRLYNNAEENVVVLNNGIKFQEASNTSVEMQLNESKESNDGEICKLFGIPAGYFNGGMTAAGMTDRDYDVFIRTIMNVLNDIESSLDRDLLLESEKGIRYWAFDTKELTRGNLKDRYEAYKIGLEKNFLQVDEVREKEDLEPIGFNWLTLGLDQVLYNPETGEIYTPNTDAVQNMGRLDQKKDENRAYSGENLIVTGPPGSGKTTWVKQNMQAGDMTVDLDAIKAAIFGQDNLHAELDDGAERIVKAVRTTLYRQIAAGRNQGRCYIVTTLADRKQLRKLQNYLNADLKVVDTPQNVCKQRVMDDATRPDKELFYALIDEWFMKWKGGEGNES